MNQTAFNVLVQAICELQKISSGLYNASEIASEQGNITDVVLLQGMADKLYEEAEDIDILLSEMEVMKTIEELKARAHELTKLAASYARQAGEVIKTDRKQGLELMRQARDASQRSQVVVGEILRRERTAI